MLLNIYKSYILPIFEYASPAWAALNVAQTDRLEKLQRRAIRIIRNLNYTAPVNDGDYHELRLCPLQKRRSFALLCYGYKLYNGLLPRILQKHKPILQSYPQRTRRGTT